MRVLLIEDHAQLAIPIARELEQEHGHEVVCVDDPIAAADRLREQVFDATVIDLLYEHLTHQFDSIRRARQVSLTGPSPLLITGLYAVHTFRQYRPSGGVVLWTSGEANRRLHLLFAYEEFQVRAFCSKSSGTGKADLLNETIQAAHANTTMIDPVLNSYLPDIGDVSVSQTLLHDECHRAIWRALSLGYHTRQEIAGVTGYAPRTVGNAIPQMFAEVSQLDVGLRSGSRPINELITYSSRNWEFFLDESVRVTYR